MEVVFERERGFIESMEYHTIGLLTAIGARQGSYCNFVPIRVARNLGKPTQTFANSTCVGNFVSADPDTGDFDPESVDNGIDVGQGQLKIDPKFASDGSQRTLSLRGPGQKKLHPEGLRLRVF